MPPTICRSLWPGRRRQSMGICHQQWHGGRPTRTAGPQLHQHRGVERERKTDGRIEHRHTTIDSASIAIHLLTTVLNWRTRVIHENFQRVKGPSATVHRHKLVIRPLLRAFLIPPAQLVVVDCWINRHEGQHRECWSCTILPPVVV